VVGERHRLGVGPGGGGGREGEEWGTCRFHPEIPDHERDRQESPSS